MYKHLSKPKNWPIFIGYGLLRLLVLLPYPILMKIGALLGKIAYYILPKNRKIIEINIKLCFPNLNKQEQQKLVKANMISYGKAIFEFLLAFMVSDKKIADLYTIEGLEHIHEALKEKKGIILLCAHFTTLELTGRMLCKNFNQKEKGYLMYRQHKNPLLEDFVVTKRLKYVNNLIPKTKILRMLKVLRGNNIVWYAQDENRSNNIVFAPFFEIPAATTTATSRIAKISGARVVPFFAYRKTDDSGYVLNILPALENFPSEDTFTDTARVNQLIENAIKQHPDQYMWALKRFSTRPFGEPEIYPKKRKK